MAEACNSSTKHRWGWGASLLVMSMALGAAAPALAQDGDEETIVVTGFRGSLAQSLNVKREATGFVDAITAEDIADFPDANLAEAIQRIPGVAIDRDAGEGRSITVRGLGADFTRVRINGMEGLTTTGGTDSSGGLNRSRQFDFNVFASELFNAIRVRKSASASTEEGSLGATVDLTTGRPFDYDGFTVALSGQAGFNDLSENWDPRAAFLISNTWGDGKFGALFSIAYSNRSLTEEGFQAVRWWDQPAAATAAGGQWDGTGDTTTDTEAPGFSWEDPAYNTDPAARAAAVSGGNFFPRIPRHSHYEHEQDRIGLTTSLQWRPTDATLVNFDFLFSSFQATRQEDFLQNFGFSRTAGQGGLGSIDVVQAQFDANGELDFGQFDDVWIRSESRFDDLFTDFSQYTLTVEHDLTDAFRVRALVGTALSEHRNPLQTSTFIDSFVNGYTIDFASNPNNPDIDYGSLTNVAAWGANAGAAFDPTNPAHWQWRNTTENPRGEIRMRPQAADNQFDTLQLDFNLDLSSAFTLSFGANLKEFSFETSERRRASEFDIPDLAAHGLTLADVTNTLTGFGDGLDLGPNTPTAWLRPDFGAIATLFDIYCNCSNAYGNWETTTASAGAANQRSVSERDLGYYVQLDVRTEIAGMPFRGDIGVRQVNTEIESTGIFAGNAITVANEYDDTLPALNAVLEVTDDIQLRFGAAKVMARPTLANLSAQGAIALGPPISVSVGNPLLEPTRATTYDLGFEWYFAPESLFSIAYFYKDIEDYAQRLEQTGVPYSTTGLPDTVVSGTPITQSTVVDYVTFINTDGGPLEGFEISYQQPFTFLPGFFSDFGAIVNYTNVSSEIDYQVSPSSSSVVTEDLLSLSPSSWNATLYYENESLSARVSAAYRDAYLTPQVPGRNGNALEGKEEVLNVDASASYALNERLTLTFEGINLTDEFNHQWVGNADRSRQSTSVYTHTGRQFYFGVRYKY